MNSDDLVAIVDFLYHGEVNIYQETLDSFLVIAEELKLKGLTGYRDDFKINESTPLQLNIRDICKRNLPEETKQVAKHKEMSSEQKVISGDLVAYHHIKTFTGGLQELDEKIKSMWVVTKQYGQSKYVCKICGKEGKSSSQIRDHIEVHHIEGISLPCNLCEKIFRSRGALSTHKHRDHK